RSRSSPRSETSSQASNRMTAPSPSSFRCTKARNLVAPWQRPWEATAMPFNPTTEGQYRGGNAIHLMTTGLSRGYEDPRWITYKQAAENGWQVRKGEKGTHIEFWEVKGRSNDKSPEIAEGTGEPPVKEN